MRGRGSSKTERRSVEVPKAGAAGGRRSPPLRAWAAVLCVSMMAACSDSDRIIAPFPPDLESIGGGLTFTVTETFWRHDGNVGPPEPTLHVETRDSFGCVNYWIESDLEVGPGVITMDVLGISRPEVCFTATGPAFSLHFFPELDGEHTLELTFGAVTDRYHLEVTEAAIRVTPVRRSFTEPVFRQFWRYPPGSFALTCDVALRSEEDCAELVETLDRELSVSQFDFPPFGEIPYPTDYDQFGHDRRATYFQFEGEEDLEGAREIVCTFGSGGNDRGINLTSWRNEEVNPRIPEDCPPDG